MVMFISEGRMVGMNPLIGPHLNGYGSMIHALLTFISSLVSIFKLRRDLALENLSHLSDARVEGPLANKTANVQLPSNAATANKATPPIAEGGFHWSRLNGQLRQGVVGAHAIAIILGFPSWIRPAFMLRK